jgi:hypothetical protein
MLGEKAESKPMPTTPSSTETSEAGIFCRVFANGRQAMTTELARHILSLGFSAGDTTRMHDLAAKNQEGRISPEELQELDNYVRVGDLLAILQSRARRALKARPR